MITLMSSNVVPIASYSKINTNPHWTWVLNIPHVCVSHLCDSHTWLNCQGPDFLGKLAKCGSINALFSVRAVMPCPPIKDLGKCLSSQDLWWHKKTPFSPQILLWNAWCFELTFCQQTSWKFFWLCQNFHDLTILTILVFVLYVNFEQSNCCLKPQKKVRQVSVGF
jgi:hypothetical protein